jgi:hypothetical protein
VGADQRIAFERRFGTENLGGFSIDVSSVRVDARASERVDARASTRWRAQGRISMCARDANDVMTRVEQGAFVALVCARQSARVRADKEERGERVQIYSVHEAARRVCNTDQHVNVAAAMRDCKSCTHSVARRE